jgi:hypothetical protein
MTTLKKLFRNDTVMIYAYVVMFGAGSTVTGVALMLLVSR